MKRSLELRQQRAALVEDAQKLMPASGAMTPENREKFDRIMADVDSMKADIDRSERAEALSEEVRAALPLGGSNPQPGSYTSAAAASESADQATLRAAQQRYTRAFNNYLRRGMNGIAQDDLQVLRSQGSTGEYRDQSNVVGAQGGFLVPTGFQAELEIALKTWGGMRQAARTITTATGNNLPWPTTNDTTVMGRRLGANAVANPAVPADQGFGQITFHAYTYTSDVIRIPNELLNDSAFDLPGEVRDRFSERIGRIQNVEFTTLPSASGGPVGWTTVVPTGVTAAVNGFTGDNLIQLEHAVDPAYRRGAAYMMHDNSILAVRLAKDTTGRFLFGAGLNAGQPDTLNGYPIITNQDMAQIGAGNKSIGFGLWTKYIIRDVAQSAVVVRLNELYALQNETAFLAFLRSDGNLLDAGTHPVSVLQHAAS